MKRKKLLIVLFAVIATVSAVLGLCGCNSCGGSGYTITVDETKPTTIYVGDVIDYTQYFIVKDKDGHQIMVTEDMLDLSEADTSKDGVLFTVTLEIGGAKESVDFIVAKKDDTVVSGGYTISVNTSKSTTITVGSTVDFTQYFTVKDKNGLQIMVTEDMLDLSKVNTSKAGTFTVTLTIGGASKSVTFTVKASGSTNTDNPAELSAILSKYSDSSNWNFAVNVVDSDNSGEYYDLEEYYEYFGDLVLRTYEDESYNQVTGYLETTYDAMYCYLPDSDGNYVKYDENSDEMYEFYGYSYIIDLSTIAGYSFTSAGSYYTASSPNNVGNNVLGDYSEGGGSWTSFNLYVSNGNISKIVAVLNLGSEGTFTMTYTFSKHGQINFTIPESTDGSGSGLPTEPTGTMTSQTYNPSTFDDKRLQDKMITEGGEYADPAIGLPSTGNVTALVVPIKFSNTDIKQEQLDNLNLAFNGTAADTGWESVKSYYYKSSYEKLNLSFDIAGVNLMNDKSELVEYYTTSKPSTDYANSTDTYNGQTYNNGDNLLLHEVLKYYESRIDLTKYDTNGDGYIDAVYLIYSEAVDYEEADFWWAYVTWNFDETEYDGLKAYYYMFTGLDFMSEDLTSYAGMTINAETYIHETGHLLGLDDYYDYETGKGSNLGLGGADMMDWNKGDHGVYSKMMLGWLTPQIIVPSATNDSVTVTIESLQAKGDAILIPLNFNNSYFCEYLLIDLYSNKGLNEAASNMTDTIMYDGAEYGVRIYHVSSWINNPWNNDYGSFTDNNNSSSSIPLIRLIEADGGNSTSSTYKGGWASESDLWQAGQSLSKVFDQFMTYDGLLLNFDITIDSIDTTSGSATITITYKA